MRIIFVINKALHSSVASVQNRSTTLATPYRILRIFLVDCKTAVHITIIMNLQPSIIAVTDKWQDDI